MKKQWICKAIERSSDMIFSYEYKCDARQRPEYFSREGGKIGFTNMIAITLNFLTKSMQAELDKFFEVVLKKTERVAKQSYFDARHKLKTEAFKMLFDNLAELATQTGEGLSELATFKGFRIFAIDGTTLNLENTYHLRGYYGVQGAGDGCAAARASVMVDVLNKGLILDACIDKLSHGERELAMRHYSRLLELNVEKPLLVHDRGYASTDMFDTLIGNGTDFLFRLQRSFNAQIDRMPCGDSMAEVSIKGRIFRLRVLKFGLPTGEIETLITNLTQDVITTNELEELYRLRWGVETAYRTIKSVLHVENFTGTSQLLVEQDFYATMFLKNMVAFARLDSDEIVTQNENPNNKYRRQTNENLLIGSLKDKLVFALLEPSPKAQARKVNKIIEEAKRHTVPIRPDRSFPRIRRNSKRFCPSGKGAL